MPADPKRGWALTVVCRGKPLGLAAVPETPINEFQAAVAAATGVPAGGQTLIFRGRRLGGGGGLLGEVVGLQSRARLLAGTRCGRRPGGRTVAAGEGGA